MFRDGAATVIDTARREVQSDAMLEADRDAAAGSSSDPWQGFRPLSSTPLPPEVEEYQLKKLAEARALSDELWSNDREAWNNAASRANSSKLSIVTFL